MDLEQMGCEDMEWTEMAHNMVKWWAIVNMV
jgi:hypothetical protein